jgi:hypothetical protein
VSGRFTVSYVDHAVGESWWCVRPPAAYAWFPRGPALWDGGWKPFKPAATGPFTETCNANTPSQAD